ncbi:MAG TPA: aminopeptidase [Burkholderiales bacterium]|nr:aminopeptidase [Burkholderiales bacterium]
MTRDSLKFPGPGALNVMCHAVMVRAVAIVSLALLAGCSNLSYYMQSVGGQLDIWRRERPIEEVLKDPATPEALRRKLATILEIRAYASRELGLPDNRSYRQYADLGRPYVVWNVFATREFSVEPEKWCFLMVGCVSYRGYFAKEDADAFAAETARLDHDVYVGPVPAYSTLGYFTDPVLNTFVHYPDYEIARLLFHELSHQLVYVRDDTVFNESFAVAVEQEGVRRWLGRSGDAQQSAAFERFQGIRTAFMQLVHKHRDELAALYRSDLAPDAMRVRKSEILRALGEEYRSVKERDWGGYAGYDPWFARKPNNAQLASIALYSQMVPAFQELLRREGGDLAMFYRAVKQLAALPKDDREAKLQALAPDIIFRPTKENEK